MAAVNSVSGARLGLGALRPRAVLMCGAVGGEGSVALQLRGAGEVAVSCQDPALLADLLATLHAAGSGETATATATFDLLDSSPCQDMALSPQLASDAFLTDTSDSLGQSEHDQGPESASSSSNTRFLSRRLRPKAASPSRQGPQQCQVCNKIFGNASALAKHKLTHSDERKYGCPVCAKAFKRQDHLNGHMLTHRNKKPYECRAEGCGKSYCDARSLRRHAENHHGAPVSTSASPPQGSGAGSCIQFAGGGSGSSGGSSGGSSPGSSKSASPNGASPSPSIKSSKSCDSSPVTSRTSPTTPNTPSGAANPSASQANSKSAVASNSKPSGAPAKPAGAPHNKHHSGHGGVSKGGKLKSGTGGGATGTGTSKTGAQDCPSPNPAQEGGSSPPRTKTFTLQRPPRTWNMQAQQSQQRSSSVSRSPLSTAARGPLAAPHRPPPEPRPVECNLCHRKFKNVPALNGHMRLHGGYFKKEAENKKLEKKEAAGPPLQTASVSVRALIEEKIISRRAAPTVSSSSESQSPTTPTPVTATGARTSFVAPAPPGTGGQPPAHPATPAVTAAATPASQEFLPPPRTASTVQQQKDATLIELLKRGNKVAVKRSASDPGHQSPGPVLSFQSADFALTSMSFQQDEGGYFSPSLQDDVYHVQDPAILLQQSSSDSIQFTSTSEQLDDLASLEDYATVTASLQDQSSIQYPVNQQLQAVLNSPLPESLADFSTYHSTVAEANANTKDVLGFQKEYIMYANSPHVGLSAPSPLPSPLKYHDSPSFTYPTPPASHEAQSPSLGQGNVQSLPILSPTTTVHSTDNFIEPSMNATDVDEVRNTSSPLSAAFFTTTMSSAEEVEEALEEVLPGESIVHGDALDMYGLSNPSPPPQSPMCVTPLPSPLSNQPGNSVHSPCTQTFTPSGTITFPRQTLHTLQSQMMPNSEDPLLSSSPKDFGSKKKFDFGGYQSYKIISHGPIDLNNPNLTGILVEANGEYKLIQAASNQLPVSWLTGATHQIISKESLTPVQSLKQGVIIKPAPIQSMPQQAQEHMERPSNEVTTSINIDEDNNIKQLNSMDGSQLAIENVNKLNSERCDSPQQNSRKRQRMDPSGFCFRSQYQSRLRNCTDEYFTPPPMLDPMRIGPGLYNEVNQTSVQTPCSHQAVVENLNVENDDSKSPRINIGSQFQANIPEVSPEDIKFDRDPSYEHLLWDPGINDALDDNEVRMFMELAMCAAMPVGGHSREHALQVLGQCGGDTHAATLRLMAPVVPTTAPERWAPEEVENFLAGLREHDKNFFKIAKQVGTKSSKQCVQFYYFWKKVTKDYKSMYLRSWSPDGLGENSSKNWWRWSNRSGRPPSTPPGTPASESGDEFPCKLCGKVFNKVKSRSAHMKSHRPQDMDSKRPRVEKCDSKLSALEDKHRASPIDNHSKMQQ